MKKNLKCAFTGHRKINITDEFREQFRLEIVRLIHEGCTEFINGGALGFDMFAAFEIIKLKKQYPIRLKMMLPCKDQAKGWSRQNQMMYDEILFNADETEYISEKYEWDCMHKRNRRMVDECDVVIAFLNKKEGGTYYTVKYAEDNKKKVINLGETL